MAEDPNLSLINGWQSDLMLVEHAWDHIKEINELSCIIKAREL